jgi:hypothetical protein
MKISQETEFVDSTRSELYWVRTEDRTLQSHGCVYLRHDSGNDRYHPL